MEIPNYVYVILTVLLIVIFIIFGKYNNLIKLQNRVKKSKANIEIYLNKRFDLIPNIVESVKGYTEYEGTTLKDIVSLRNSYQNKNNLSINEAEKMNNELNKYLAVVENYPNIKANTNFISLQNQLSSIETELESSRRIYNDEVTRYNTLIDTIPSNIIARIFNFKKAELFQIEEHKKENIKIDL